jgi:hypothetical protein
MGILLSHGTDRVSRNIRVSYFTVPAHLIETLRSDVLGPNQACTLFGASPGSNVISGSSYIDVGYGLQVNELWTKNFVVLAVMFILFQLAQVFAIEYLPVSVNKISFFFFSSG